MDRSSELTVDDPPASGGPLPTAPSPVLDSSTLESMTGDWSAAAGTALAAVGGTRNDVPLTVRRALRL
jgi:hypothetical protein